MAKIVTTHANALQQLGRLCMLPENTGGVAGAILDGNFDQRIYDWEVVPSDFQRTSDSGERPGKNLP